MVPLVITVILDANLLLYSFKHNLDILDSLESALNQRIKPIILTPTITELSKLHSRGGAGKAARLALNIAERFTKLRVDLAPGETPDDAIARVAKKLKCVVATNDKELLERLRGKGIPRAFLSQGKRIIIEGWTG